MSWKGIDKGPKMRIVIQFILWTIGFAAISMALIKLGIINY
tara:strand:+ start:873 stop:995 length:123 start_codon:yes stop_codon:yes gene_type:complete